VATTEPWVTLVDANVLIDVIAPDPVWRDASRRALQQAEADGPLAINPLIYAELAGGFGTRDRLEKALEGVPLTRLDLPWHAAFPAAEAFRGYRTAGGARRSPLPDFYIGAHAEVSGLRLLTRDEQRYRSYFPTVELLIPS
jgi:predicted nucleic acid-binding protein